MGPRIKNTFKNCTKMHASKGIGLQTHINDHKLHINCILFVFQIFRPVPSPNSVWTFGCRVKVPSGDKKLPKKLPHARQLNGILQQGNLVGNLQNRNVTTSLQRKFKGNLTSGPFVLYVLDSIAVA